MCGRPLRGQPFYSSQSPAGAHKGMPLFAQARPQLSARCNHTTSSPSLLPVPATFNNSNPSVTHRTRERNV
jgi:hypothetical protein